MQECVYKISDVTVQSSSVFKQQQKSCTGGGIICLRCCHLLSISLCAIKMMSNDGSSWLEEKSQLASDPLLGLTGQLAGWCICGKQGEICRGRTTQRGKKQGLCPNT